MTDPDESGVPWSAAEAIIAVVLIPFITFSLAGVFVLLGSALLTFLFRPVPQSLPLVSTGLAAFFASTGMVWFFAVRGHRASAAQIGFNGFKARLDIPLAVVGQITAFVGIAVYSLLINAVGVEVPKQLDKTDFGASPVGLALAVLVVVILAPLGEELFFRGFVYPALRERWGVLWGMVASSAMFALFHVHPLLFPPMFIIAMVMVVLFEYRKTLAPNIILHALNNLIALLSVYGLS